MLARILLPDEQASLTRLGSEIRRRPQLRSSGRRPKRSLGHFHPHPRGAGRQEGPGLCPWDPANLTPTAREKSWVVMRHNAQANVQNRQAAQLAALLRANGATFRAIADQLNQSGYRTRYGKAFHPMGVQRLLPKPAA